MNHQKFHDKGAIALQLRAGNTHAFQYILEEFGPALCFFASRLTGNEAAAMAIAEEALLQLWEARKKFHSLTDIRNFLYAATRDGCCTHGQMKQSTIIDEYQIQQEAIRAEVLRQVCHKLPPAADNTHPIQSC